MTRTKSARKAPAEKVVEPAGAVTPGVGRAARPADEVVAGSLPAALEHRLAEINETLVTLLEAVRGLAPAATLKAQERPPAVEADAGQVALPEAGTGIPVPSHRGEMHTLALRSFRFGDDLTPLNLLRQPLEAESLHPVGLVVESSGNGRLKAQPTTGNEVHGVRLALDQVAADRLAGLEFTCSIKDVPALRVRLRTGGSERFVDVFATIASGEFHVRSSNKHDNPKAVACQVVETDSVQFLLLLDEAQSPVHRIEILLAAGLTPNATSFSGEAGQALVLQDVAVYSRV